MRTTQVVSDVSVYNDYFSKMSKGKKLIVLFIHPMDFDTIFNRTFNKFDTKFERVYKPLLEMCDTNVDLDTIGRHDHNFFMIEFGMDENEEAEKLWKAIDVKEIYAEYWEDGDSA